MSPGQTRDGVLLPYRTPNQPIGPGWLIWETTCLNLFGDEAIVSRGALPLGGNKRIHALLHGLETVSVDQRHDLFPSNGVGDPFKLELGVNLSNQYRSGDLLEYKVITLRITDQSGAVVSDLKPGDASFHGELLSANQPRSFFTPTLDLLVMSWPYVLRIDIEVRTRVAGDRSITAQLTRSIAAILQKPLVPASGGHTAMGVTFNFIDKPKVELVSDADEW